MSDTEQSETAKTEALENKTEPVVTPQVEEKKTEDSEVERLRKEKEQIEMERNQLRNKLQAEEDAKAKAEAKKLEEKEEYKTLFEQEKAKREAIEQAQAEEQRKKELETQRTTVLAEYSDDVKAVAEDAGVALADVTDEAIADFKGRLDKIQTRLGNKTVTANNPSAPSNKTEYTGEELRQILNDPVKRDAYYRAQGGITAQMMGEA